MRSPAKARLRRHIREQIALVSPTARAAASESIRTSIASLPGWQAAVCAAAYVALPSEPDLNPFDWTPQRRLFLPRIEDGTLVLREVGDPAHLLPGPFGLLEPDPARCPAADHSRLDFIFVPGVAFTRDGGRLGRGGGYYDRLLAVLPRTVCRIGVCFPFQLVDDVPGEDHDQRVDLVVC